jgi:hypothetical protein
LKDRIYWEPSKEYIQYGMNWFDSRVSESTYLVFSNRVDIVKSWNIESLTNSSVRYFADYMSADNAMMDLSIMLEHCHHLFLSLGTYAYWAGWKSKGYVLMAER